MESGAREHIGPRCGHQVALVGTVWYVPCLSPSTRAALFTLTTSQREAKQDEAVPLPTLEIDATPALCALLLALALPFRDLRDLHSH